MMTGYCGKTKRDAPLNSGVPRIYVALADPSMKIETDNLLPFADFTRGKYLYVDP